MSISKVTRNFQITLPSEVRTLQHIQVGDKVVFTIEDGKIQLFKMRKDTLNQAFGLWGKGPSGKAEVRKIRAEWSKRQQAS